MITTQFFTGRMPFLPPNRVKALKAVIIIIILIIIIDWNG